MHIILMHLISPMQACRKLSFLFTLWYIFWFWSDQWMGLQHLLSFWFLLLKPRFFFSFFYHFQDDSLLIAFWITLCATAVVSLSELDLPFKDTLDWTKFSVTVTRNEDLLQYIVKDKDNQQYTVKDIDNQTFTKLHNNLLKVNNALTSSPTERTSWFSFLIWSTSF